MNAGLVLAVAAGLAFSATNGLHDAANAIATLVGTRAARPGPAVALAAIGNVIGPLVLGRAVADTVAGVVTVPDADVTRVLGAALTGAVIWNLVTWSRGLPSSSGHALLGGLVGAAVVEGGSGAVSWGGFDGIRPVGVLGIGAVLALAPLLGLAAGFALERLARWLARPLRRAVQAPVTACQWVMSGGPRGQPWRQRRAEVRGDHRRPAARRRRDRAPVGPGLGRARVRDALTLGTALGGWPIVRTIGRRIIRLRPLDGLASETASVVVILGASLTGAPVSTTQVVASSVVGVGGGRRRWRHVRWPLVRSMLLAWLVTVPAAAAFAALALVPWRWST